MSWLPEIEEIHRRRHLAEACGGPEAVARHHAQGKLTVRERVAALADPGSFREVGKLAGRATYDASGQLKGFEPAPYVMGIARINGRPVAIGGEDYTIRAGTGFGQGAFSRRTLTAAPDGTIGPRQTGGTRSERVEVERAKADALRRELDARWERNQGDVRVRQWDGVPVSRDPASYNLFDNSNHATARWLQRLGCEVRGFPLMANFQVEEKAR